MFLYGFFIFLAHSSPLTISLGARYSFAAVGVAQGGAEVLLQAHECIYLQVYSSIFIIVPGLDNRRNSDWLDTRSNKCIGIGGQT